MRMTIAALLLALPATASAQCYENLGQTGCPDEETFSLNDLRGLSCQNLWYVRNAIFDAHGYCFKTEAAETEFDNSVCYEEDPAMLKFNRHEQANIDRIVRVEREKSCPRP